MKQQYYIGLMSGTSMDGIDSAVVAFDSNDAFTMVATHCEPMPTALKESLLALCTPGDNAIVRMGETDKKLGACFANSVNTLLKKNGLQPEEIIAIGSHGQNIRHAPNADFPFTLQIGDPNVIAARTGITTVADFRRRDIALGGQGAPLAPGFHQFLFYNAQHDRCIVNIGGIANITLLSKDRRQAVIGYDTGPGNTLMDVWCQQHRQQMFDNHGDWASSGKIQHDLLRKLLADPYFAQASPKSTGREYFNLAWLQHYLKEFDIAANDVQATLLELTAQSIIQAIDDRNSELFVCGGGAKNLQLINRLKEIHHATVQSTSVIGLDPQWVEAATFAWLAKQTIENKPGNLPSVTGARTRCVLGGIYAVN